MKKNQFALLSFGLLLLAFLASCTRTDKVLPKKEGEWTVTYWQRLIYDHDTLWAEEYYNGGYSYRFNKSGTGRIFNRSGFSNDISFEWTYDKEKETLGLTFSSGDNFVVYSVLESNRKSQTWFSSRYIVYTNTPLRRYDDTIYLERVDE